MKWADIHHIAEALYEQYPGVDPLTINFVDLHHYVVGLADFNDDPQRGGERVLEAIQQLWIEEIS